ncbi:MAG: acyl-CoA dehydrogenase family protein [Pseudomonadales bacterium]
MTASDDLLQEAERLSAVFRDEAERIEQSRRVPLELSRMMAEAGFYRLGVPRSLGGLEAPAALSSRIVETLARGDASCGWLAFIGATSGTALAAIEASAGQTIFASPSTHLAGVFAPTGRARRVDGGFVVNGRWQWGSGTQNADWILGGCLLCEGDAPMLDGKGRPRSHMMLMPAKDITFLDTWHVSGLRGTGSLDFEVHELFVPETHAVGFLDLPKPEGALYVFPNITFLALGIAAVSLGIARAAIDEFVALALTKKRAGSARTVAEQPHTHMTLAKAEAALRGARLFYYDAIDTAWRQAECGDVSLDARRDLRLATTNAVAQGVEVVDAMYTLAGGTSVYESSRLQRYFRDIHVATQHIMVAPSTYETAGRLFLGLDANVAMF